jgi:hypothetical protein
MTITEVTLGEVYRLMLTQGQTLTGIGTGLEKRPTWDDMNRINAVQDQAIKDLEDANRWLVRTVGAALVTALGTAVVLAGRVMGAG